MVAAAAAEGLLPTVVPTPTRTPEMGQVEEDRNPVVAEEKARVDVTGKKVQTEHQTTRRSRPRPPPLLRNRFLPRPMMRMMEKSASFALPQSNIPQSRLATTEPAISVRYGFAHCIRIKDALIAG